MLFKLLDKVRDTGSFIESSAFSYEDYSELDSFDIEFKNVVFENCRFNKCDFTKAGFHSVTFQNCSFSECDFTDSFWKKSVIISSKCDGNTFHGAHARECTLTSSSFRYSDFSDTFLEKLTAENCNFSEACISRAKIKSPVLKN